MSFWRATVPNNSIWIQIVLVWTSLFALFYVYLGYPLVLALIASLRPRCRSRLGYEPTLSILIAAYNEAAGIDKKISDTLKLEYPGEKIEIIVLSDGSSDRTDDIVKSFADPRVRLMRTPVRRGKT